jgi:hypothetical protein
MIIGEVQFSFQTPLVPLPRNANTDVKVTNPKRSTSAAAVLALRARHLGWLSGKQLLAEHTRLAVRLPLVEELDPVDKLLDDPAVTEALVDPFGSTAAAALPASALAAVSLLLFLPASNEVRAKV